MSGPSGCGKSTLLKRLFADFPNEFGFSVSHTTRKPRAGELDGREYHFVTKEQMLSEIDQGKFIEHAVFGGNMYGTTFAAVEAVTLEHDKICILDVDRQGVESIKKCADMDAYFLFIKPPSLEVLAQRLRGRGTETDESFEKRMASVASDMAFAEQPGAYDKAIVNDVLDTAYSELKSFVKEKYHI